MTVTTTNVIDSALGNGAATSFPFTFRCPDTSFVAVYLAGILQFSGFIVVVNANGIGGTVTFTSAPAAGVEVDIVLDPPFEQTTSFANGGAFLPEAHDIVADRAVLREQRLLHDVGLAIRAPVNEQPLDPLPAKAARAGKFSVFDANGMPAAASGTGADAALRADLAANSGASLIGWLRASVGASLRTIADKIAETLSVKDFGAKGDGVTDDTLAFQAAHDALGITGGMIYIPPGQYIVSSVTVSKSCKIIGAGQSVTQIYAKDATSNVFNLTGSTTSIRDLSVLAAVTRTGGAYILCNTTSGQVTVADCYFVGFYWGIRVTASGGPFYFRDTLFRNGAAGAAQAVRIESGTAISLDALNVANSSNIDSGVAILSCSDVTLLNCQLINCNYALNVTPGTGQVATSICATNTFFDNSGINAIRLLPISTTGTIQRVRFNSCWMSSAGGIGVNIDTSGFVGCSVDGVTLTDCEVFLNGSHGMVLSGAGAKNIKVLGGKIAQNAGAGIIIFPPVGHVQIIGGSICAVGGLTGNTGYGINIQTGALSNLLIADNDLSGNTSGALSNSSTGSNRRIVQNTGYNDRASMTSGITVTASPFTYTAGDQPETVYINGGTVSLVTVDGIAVFQSTNTSVRLSPGKSVVVTYSSAPGMAKTIE